jgi:putative ABC transport system permease protein
MRVSSILPLATAALARNRLRSALTTLGIVIGVAAVVAMQSMGEGATAYVGEAISGMGSNMLIAAPGSSRTYGPPSIGVPLFTVADVEAIRRQARDVSHLAAANLRLLRVVAGSRHHSVNVGGVSPEYFQIRQWGVSRGRLTTAGDERQASLACVVGQTVADTLFPGQDPIGQELRVQGLACRVVGLMERKGTSTFGVDQDDVLFMPFETFARRIMGTDRVGFIMIAASSADRIDDARRQVEAVLLVRRRIPPGEEPDFAVRDPREIQALLESVTGILTALLAGVAALSLAVGGIGIMNIMLVSVTERTREIGVRLAVGARTGDVLLQFLMEATLLSSVGGAFGLLLGLAAGYAAAGLIGIPYVVPRAALPVAFGVSVLVGVGFGVMPARRAAHLNPLSALRFE